AYVGDTQGRVLHLGDAASRAGGRDRAGPRVRPRRRVRDRERLLRRRQRARQDPSLVLGAVTRTDHRRGAAACGGPEADAGGGDIAGDASRLSRVPGRMSNGVSGVSLKSIAVGRSPMARPSLVTTTIATRYGRSCGSISGEPRMLDSAGPV